MKIETTKSENKLGLTYRLLLGLASIVTSSAIASMPVVAATLANSEAAFELENLSHRPDTTSTLTDIDGSTNAAPDGGTVSNSAESIALFPSQATTASSDSFSLVFGEGSNYFGEALSEARVRGTFLVEAGESFAFDFVSSLELETSIDDSQLESATATGEIAFLLLDNSNRNNAVILDDFVLLGSLSTDDTDDFLRLESSDNITLSENLQATAFGANEEFAAAFVQGSFERFFTRQTDLTLIEVQTNNVSVVARPVSVPEFDFSFGYSILGGALALKRIYLSNDRKI